MMKFSRFLIQVGAVLLFLSLSACGGSKSEHRSASRIGYVAAPSIDTPTFAGPRSNYVILKTANGFIVADLVGLDGNLSFANVDRIKFSDVTISLNMSQKIKTISEENYKLLVELYIAFFNRVPDAEGLSYWIDQIKSGLLIDQVANNFYNAAIAFSNLTNYSEAMSNEDFIKIIYKNVLGRSDVDDEGLNYWSKSLANGSQTRGSLIRTILNSAHTFKGDPKFGWVADLLDNKFIMGNSFANLGGVTFNKTEDSISMGMAIATAVSSTDISAANAIAKLFSMNTQTPISASAGALQSVIIGKAVDLQGSAKTTIPNIKFLYQWILTSKPSDSNANFTSTNTISTSITPDKVGTYTATLVVNYDTGLLPNESTPTNFAVSAQAVQSVTINVAKDANPTPFELRSFNLAAFDKDYWSVPADNEAALQFIKNEGGNAVSLDWMVEFADDGIMSINGGNQHPSWSDIASVINRAKALGLYVILKPHVISKQCCGQNRNSSNTNVSKFLPTNFFPAWQAYLLDMSKNTPSANVDAISIGTELDFLDWRYRPDWAALIQTMRSAYKGALTYDSMFSQYSASKSVGDVVFWDLLDFISCSFYVRLTLDNSASLPTLMSLMRNNQQVDITDAIGHLEKISTQYGKQVFTLEGGYQSANGALWNVNDFFGVNAIENQELQARGLDAYLGALNADKGKWLKGVSLWDVQARHFRSATWSDPNYRNGWGMYNKVSAATVKKWYSIP